MNRERVMTVFGSYLKVMQSVECESIRKHEVSSDGRRECSKAVCIDAIGSFETSLFRYFMPLPNRSAWRVAAVEGVLSRSQRPIAAGTKVRGTWSRTAMCCCTVWRHDPSKRVPRCRSFSTAPPSYLLGELRALLVGSHHPPSFRFFVRIQTKTGPRVRRSADQGTWRYKPRARGLCGAWSCPGINKVEAIATPVPSFSSFLPPFSLYLHLLSASLN